MIEDLPWNCTHEVAVNQALSEVDAICERMEKAVKHLAS